MFKKLIKFIDDLLFGKPPIIKRVLEELHLNQHALLEAQSHLEWATQQVTLYQKRVQRLKDQKNELEKNTEYVMANLHSTRLHTSTY